MSSARRWILAMSERALAACGGDDETEATVGALIDAMDAVLG